MQCCVLLKLAQRIGVFLSTLIPFLNNTWQPCTEPSECSQLLSSIKISLPVLIAEPFINISVLCQVLSFNIPSYQLVQSDRKERLKNNSGSITGSISKTGCNLFPPRMSRPIPPALSPWPAMCFPPISFIQDCDSISFPTMGEKQKKKKVCQRPLRQLCLYLLSKNLQVMLSKFIRSRFIGDIFFFFFPFPPAVTESTWHPVLSQSLACC